MNRTIGIDFIFTAMLELERPFWTRRLRRPNFCWRKLENQMNRSIHATWLLAVLFLVSGNAMATSAWWVLCDSCTTETHFKYQALNAPGTYTPIYVTNRETNDTRKYNRWTSIEDLDGVMVQLTEVSQADFPIDEKSVFEQAVEQASTLFVGMPRSRLTEFSAAGLRRSVVEEIASGRLSSDFLSSLRNRLMMDGHFPSEVSISSGIGAVLRGISSSVSVTSSGVRKFPLQATVTYEDGSKIQITLSADASEWSEVSVFDTDGNEIAVVTPGDGSGNASYDPGGNDGREFRFGGGQDALDAIFQLQRAIDAMQPPGDGGGGCFTYTGLTGGTTCVQE